MSLDRPLTKREAFHVARLRRDLSYGNLTEEKAAAVRERIARIEAMGLQASYAAQPRR